MLFQRVAENQIKLAYPRSLELIPWDGYWFLDSSKREKGDRERVKRWFLKQAGCESLSLVVQGPARQAEPVWGDAPQPETSPHSAPQHTLSVPFWAQILLLLWAPWLHKERLLNYSLTHNCSWRICGWAPTLDKDYRRYKSWTMAPLLT